MEAFDPSMYPHSVYVLAETDSFDTVAAVIEGFPAIPGGLTPVACWVNIAGSRPAMTGDQEVTVTLAEVWFPVNPGARKGYRLLRVSDGLSLRCLGRGKDRAYGFNFAVPCEVIE